MKMSARSSIFGLLVGIGPRAQARGCGLDSALHHEHARLRCFGMTYVFTKRALWFVIAHLSVYLVVSADSRGEIRKQNMKILVHRIW